MDNLTREESEGVWREDNRLTYWNKPLQKRSGWGGNVSGLEAFMVSMWPTRTADMLRNTARAKAARSA